MSRITVAVFTCAAGFVAASSAFAQPMFRGGPDHRGIYDSPQPSLTEPLWKFKTNGRVVSSPVVAGDAVYFGSTDSFIYAVNRGDGSLRWKFATRGAVSSSPAIVNGAIIASSGDGRVYAIDAATGKQLWAFKTAGESRFTARGIHGAVPPTEMMPDPFDVFLSSPAVADGVVYIGSGDHNVYAIDAANGSLRWKFETRDVVHASPAVAAGVVYIGSWDRNMYALNANSGKEQWRFQTGNDTVTHNQIGIASSAAVADGAVYFGCRDGHFYAVDAKTGQLRWSVDNKGGWVIASPAARNGVVYFPTADGMRLKAVNGASGEIVYSVAMRAISFSSPAIVGDQMYFGSSDGWVHRVDLATGATRAEFQSDGSKANASKYIDADGHMKSEALYPDLTLDGVIIGVHNMFTLGSFLSSPVIVDGVLYIGSTDGHLYALK
ncbi:MAG TPA: PQQ-binding-like beta-propeller repeat protein [Gemmatimonadaceae bacterium]|nr:PQQ-binding-like beta-propeller repeat protein [Gemmatimonadaceae bacterium]